MCIEFQHLSCQVVVIKGLAYLLILFQLLLKDWINFGIYWKNLLSHSWPWPWVCGFGLGLACLWPWPSLTGLGFGLDTMGLVNIPGVWSLAWTSLKVKVTRTKL